MKSIICFCALLLSITVSAQTFPNRIDLDPILEPFYHGVASGDPQTDRVIIWTRVTTSEPEVNVYWKMATDTNFNDLVAQGYYKTDTSRDYTVKVDVTGLQPNTWYFYQFTANSKNSLIGRTKTTPTGDIDQLRLATVSCSNYQSGYYNAYERLRARNDIDAVLHLGDYIYEYGDGEYGELSDRVPQPESEILSLSDYRMRHSFYKLDPMLRKLHQLYPFITVWDDHESADDSYIDGAVNHQNSEGSWSNRKAVSIKAYNEWMPIRSQNPEAKIFRKVSFGNLADIFFLDTRLFGRVQQDPATIFGNDDTTRTLIGEEQMTWLKNELQNSTAKWKIMAQQVMVAPFQVLGLSVNADQWDGYPSERKRLFDFINQNNINNFIVLTGDIHTAWAMDLPFGKVPYKPNGTGSAGVEFVSTSITSPGFPIGFVAQAIKDMNPHCKYVDLTRHGYSVLNLTKEKAQNDFYFVKTILQPDTTEYFAVGYYTECDSNHLNRNEERTYLQGIPGVVPPETPKQFDPTAVDNHDIIITGIYPNPFSTYVGIQYYVDLLSDIRLEIVDVTGKIVASQTMKNVTKGVHFSNINTDQLQQGVYILHLNDGEKNYSRVITKL